MTTILRIDGSARSAESVSRQLTDAVIDRLLTANPGATVVTRDLLGGVPLLDDTAVSGLAVGPDDQTPAQSSALATSDELVRELLDADIIVLGSPIYNFSVPAAVKAYIDQIARAGQTFTYTDEGPVGLVTDRPTYIVSASGGVEFGSDYDFATPYLRLFFGFLGITSVEVIGADSLMADHDAAMSRAHRQIEAAFGAVGASN